MMRYLQFFFLAAAFMSVSGVSNNEASTVVIGYDPKQFYGELSKDEAGKPIVVENKSQTHDMKNFMLVRVMGLKKNAKAREKGRVRIAVWNNKETFAKEGVKPFRAASYWAKAAENDEMVFRIGGLSIDGSYAFFAHFDEENVGKVRRTFLSVPRDQYMFSNASNQGRGPGLKRKGFSAPDFEDTLIKFTKPGQVVELRL